MNFFHLVRGFTPSVLVLQQILVSKDLLDSHISIDSIRILKHVLQMNIPRFFEPPMLQKGTGV